MTAYLMLITEIEFKGEKTPCHKYVAINEEERFFVKDTKIGDSPKLMQASAEADGYYDLNLIGTVVQILD